MPKSTLTTEREPINAAHVGRKLAQPLEVGIIECDILFLRDCNWWKGAYQTSVGKRGGLGGGRGEWGNTPAVDLQPTTCGEHSLPPLGGGWAWQTSPAGIAGGGGLSRGIKELAACCCCLGVPTIQPSRCLRAADCRRSRAIPRTPRSPLPAPPSSTPSPPPPHPPTPPQPPSPISARYHGRCLARATGSGGGGHGGRRRRRPTRQCPDSSCRCHSGGRPQRGSAGPQHPRVLCPLGRRIGARRSPGRSPPPRCGPGRGGRPARLCAYRVWGRNSDRPRRGICSPSGAAGAGPPTARLPLVHLHWSHHHRAPRGHSSGLPLHPRRGGDVGGGGGGSGVGVCL